MTRRFLLSGMALSAIGIPCRGQTNKPISPGEAPNDGKPYNLKPYSNEKSLIDKASPYFQSTSHSKPSYPSNADGSPNYSALPTYDRESEVRLSVGARISTTKNGDQRKWIYLIVTEIPKEDAITSKVLLMNMVDAESTLLRLKDILRIRKTWVGEGTPKETKAVTFSPVAGLAIGISKYASADDLFPVTISYEGISFSFYLPDNGAYINIVPTYATFVHMYEDYLKWLRAK